MSFSIRYSNDALDDLREIRYWYDQINTSLTESFIAALTIAERDICTNPLAFSRIGYKDFRRAIVKKFPYRITFRINDTMVDVFGVIHFSRSNRHTSHRLKK